MAMDNLLDIRLDFINNIDQVGIDLMIEIRKAYIQMDECIVHLASNPSRPLDEAARRSLALARTNLETSLQYAIKTLCIQFENKPE